MHFVSTIPQLYYVVVCNYKGVVCSLYPTYKTVGYLLPTPLKRRSAGERQLFATYQPFVLHVGIQSDLCNVIQ